MLLPKFTKNSPSKKSFTTPFSLHLSFFNLRFSQTIGTLRNYGPPKFFLIYKNWNSSSISTLFKSLSSFKKIKSPKKIQCFCLKAIHSWWNTLCNCRTNKFGFEKTISTHCVRKNLCSSHTDVFSKNLMYNQPWNRTYQ